MCAHDKQTGKYELVKIPPGYKVGERVKFEGYEGEPEKESSMSKKLSKIMDGLRINEEGFVCFKDGKAKIEAGYLTSNLKNGVVG